MKNLLIVATLAATLGSFAITAERVNEIAGWLPEKPKADGARITDRASWDRLAASANGKGEINAAEALLGAPIPDAPDAEYLQGGAQLFHSHGGRPSCRRCFGYSQIHLRLSRTSSFGYANGQR